MSNAQFYRLAGAMVFLSSLAGLFYNINFIWISVFFGIHIVQYSFSGFCLLQKVLPKKD